MVISTYSAHRRIFSLPGSAMYIRAILIGVLLTSSFIHHAPGSDDFPEPYDSQDPGKGLTPAERSIAGIELPDGFRATLFAAEPDVRQPIAMAIDERRRLWVAENYTYADRQKNYDVSLRDRIIVLEDQDGDGRADDRIIFWDKAVRLTSVEIGFGGVWALAPPYLLFIPDADGDARPDGPPEVILDGWDSGPVRHNFANGLRWGPDGWLYGRHGIMATSDVGPPGTPESERISINCGIWRFHPTDRTFEVVCRGTTNPFGMDWDKHGELFFINTVIGHLWHALPGAHFKRMYGEDFNPHLYQLIDQTADHVHWDSSESWTAASKGEVSDGTDEAGGGLAHSGLMIYQAENWPSKYRNDLFTLNFHGRRINRESLQRSGGSYRGIHQPDLIRWNDPWFRGIELLQGPAGEVYVADWSDLGECHENDGVHRSSGRIIRIDYGLGRPSNYPRSQPEPSDAQLVAWQTHPNVWYARISRRLLQERAANGAELNLAQEKLWALLNHQKEVSIRLRALWSLYCIGGVSQADLIGLLEDSNEHIRTWSIRLLVDAGSPSEGTIRALETLGESESSGLVLTTLASILQRFPLERRWDLAESIASHPEFNDDLVLPLMLWYAIEPSVMSSPTRAARFASTQSFGPLPEFIARRLTYELQERPELTGLIVAELSTTDSETRRELLRGMVAALQGLSRADEPPGWRAVQDRLVVDPEVEVQELSRSLAVLFGDGRAINELFQIARDPNANLRARREAVRGLITRRAEGLNHLLTDLMKERDLASESIRGLARSDLEDAPALILDRYRSLPGKVKGDAVEALASRPSFVPSLLDGVEAGIVERTDVSAFLVRQMRSSVDDQLRARLAKIWPEYRPLTVEASKQIEALRKQLGASQIARADLKRGRLLFDQKCSSCHKLFGNGGAVAPELTGAQRTDLGYLLENIVAPNAIVAEDYRMSLIALADGRVINGIVTDQEGQTVTIQTPTERFRVPEEDIEAARKLEASLMPEGLLDDLSQEDRAALIRYLQSPSQVSLPEEGTGAD